MKTTNENLNGEQTLADRCVESCKKLLAGIDATRNRIANEFHETLEANGQLVQLALNEAEALAWQTAYPHLLFPALAMEKVQSVAAWQTRQQSLHRRHPAFAEAA
ncbi:MAG TPA: hypothetical protein VNN22_26270 [Verrucomicrobiae bacterium]|nr:hypothetical protein [Verrucomicrobiae bacterium]